jgi:hypothetical protein
MTDFARRDTQSSPTELSHPTQSKRNAVPSRWIACVLVSVSLPLVLLFVTPVAPQNGLLWDLLMGAGMLAAGLIVSVPIVAPRVWTSLAGDPHHLREILFFHRDMSYLAIVLVLIHTVGILLADWTVIEYFKLSAPWSMLAALLAGVLLIGIVVSSIYRLRLNIRYNSWRAWHIGLSTLTVALVGFHILDAGYFVNSPIKKAIFVAIAAGPTLAAFGNRVRGVNAHARRQISTEQPIAAFSGHGAARRFSLRVVTLLVIFWMSSIFIFAVPKPESRAESQALNCIAVQCESP